MCKFDFVPFKLQVRLHVRILQSSSYSARPMVMHEITLKMNHKCLVSNDSS